MGMGNLQRMAQQMQQARIANSQDRHM